MEQTLNSIFSESGNSIRPVIIHRAILGSVERLTAILAENYGGSWPFWLSPRQAKIITIHKSQNDYAEKVRQRIFDAGFEIDFEPDTSETLNKQVRTAEVEKYNFILVAGAAEIEHGTVNVRSCGNVVSLIAFLISKWAFVEARRSRSWRIDREVQQICKGIYSKR